RVQRAIQERVAREPASLQDDGLSGIEIGDRLDDTVTIIRMLSGDAPDLVVRDLKVAGSHRAAAVFFETLGRADLVASQVIRPLTYDAVQAGLKVPTDPSRLERWIRT